MQDSLWVGVGVGPPDLIFLLLQTALPCLRVSQRRAAEREATGQNGRDTLRHALRSLLTSSVSSLDLLPPDLGEAGVGSIVTSDLSELIHAWGLQGKNVTEQGKACVRHTPDVPPDTPETGF